MNIQFSCFTLSMPDVIQPIVVAHYDVNTLKPEDLLILPYRGALLRAVPSRKAEHLAGRLAARKAMTALGMRPYIPAIGTHRQPLWPSGVIGSISHTHRLALAAVALSSEGVCGLGLDIEPVISTQQMADILDGVLLPVEHGLLLQSELSQEEVATLIFSAKESLFKALFPRVGEYFDFSAAFMTALSPSTQRFTLTLAESLTPALKAGMTFDGLWHCLEGDILTLIRF